jgi:hypothetical protein
VDDFRFIFAYAGIYVSGSLIQPILRGELQEMPLQCTVRPKDIPVRIDHSSVLSMRREETIPTIGSF